MKNKTLVYIILLYSLIFAGNVLAQSLAPSFEVYSVGQYSCPILLASPPPAVELAGTTLTVSAKIYDVSGVASALAKAQDPENPGQYIDGFSLPMYDDGNVPGTTAGDGIYEALTDVSTWPAGFVYMVDISVRDILGFECVYTNVGNFGVSNPTQIVFFTSSESFPAQGDITTLSATLQTSTGTAIEGKTITFLDTTDGINIGSSPEPTNILGEATIEYNIDPGATAFDHILRASFAGDATLEQSSAETTINVISQNCATSNGATVCINASAISPSATNIGSWSVTGSTTGWWDGFWEVTLNAPETTTRGFSVTLEKAGGAPFSGETIYFTDTTEDRAMGSAVTDAFGVAIATYTFTSGLHDSEHHFIEASYPGNGSYSSSSDTLEISVRPN